MDIERLTDPLRQLHCGSPTVADPPRQLHLGTPSDSSTTALKSTESLVHFNNQGQDCEEERLKQ
jgi:hypothetical protein